jgi:hypothetical protein
MSDEQQVIRDLAKEFIAQKGDELWNLCCQNYGFNNADTRKQNAILIGAHLGFQMALQTSLSLAKIKEESNELPIAPADSQLQKP